MSSSKVVALHSKTQAAPKAPTSRTFRKLAALGRGNGMSMQEQRFFHEFIGEKFCEYLQDDEIGQLVVKYRKAMLAFEREGDPDRARSKERACDQACDDLMKIMIQTAANQL